MKAAGPEPRAESLFSAALAAALGGEVSGFAVDRIRRSFNPAGRRARVSPALQAEVVRQTLRELETSRRAAGLPKLPRNRTREPNAFTEVGRMLKLTPAQVEKLAYWRPKRRQNQ
jgi:hypothetical protein